MVVGDGVVIYLVICNVLDFELFPLVIKLSPFLLVYRSSKALKST